MSKFSEFFVALNEGHVPATVILRNTPFQSIPFVFVREVDQDIHCFFTVSLTSSPDHHLCRVWGVVQTQPRVISSFPFGGPWFRERGREEVTLPEWDIKQLPVWCQMVDVPERWSDGQRWYLAKRSQSPGSRAGGIAWETSRSRLRALPPVRDLIRAIEDKAKCSDQTGTGNVGLGLLPVVTCLPASKLIEVLAPILTAGDAVYGLSRSSQDFIAFDSGVNLWTPKSGKGTCQTLVLWYPSVLVSSIGQVEDPIRVLLPVLKSARRMILIVDHAGAIQTWCDRFAGLVYLAQDIQHLSLCLRGPSTKKAWLQMGRAYLEAKLPAAARHCFGCADAAKWLNRVGGYKTPTKLPTLDSVHGGNWDQKTALACERAERWDLASAVWRRLGDEASVLRCRIEHYAQKGEWLKAARVLMRHGQYLEAGQALEKAGKNRRAMRLYLEKVDDPERLMALGVRTGEEHFGAKLLERYAYHEQALVFYRRCGHDKGLERMLHMTGRFTELEERLVARGDRERLLVFYEQRCDVQKYMRLLSNQAVSHQEAIALYTNHEYFRAYVHLLLVQDWTLAGACALKIGDYEGAAEAYIQAGMSYEAGIALSKTQHLERALELLLNTEHDGPKFAKASRVLARIKNRPWLRSLAESLLAKGAYGQAEWLSEKLRLGVLHGEILLAQDRVQEAIALWSGLDSANEVEAVCAVCLSRDRLAVGISLVIDHKIGFAAWLKGAFSPEATPCVFALAWRYFSTYDDHVRLDSWVSRLARSNPLKWAAEFLPVLELLGDWRRLLGLLAEWRSDPVVWARFVDQTLEGDGRALTLSPEGQVVRHFLMNDPEGVEQAIAGLTMTEKNAPLFLLRASFEVAHSFLTYEKMTEQVVGGSHPMCLYLAREAERQNLFRIAAAFFLQFGDETHALEALEKGGEFELLAQLCVARGCFLQAIAAYERMPAKPFRQIAQVYEMANIWERALNYYDLAGDGRGRRRCLQRMNRLLQGSLPND